MQTMSTAMATLLKSGKQIGSNKPTHEVVIGESGLEYDWLTTTTSKSPVGAISSHSSMVELDDGSIMIVYSRGTSVYQAFIADVETLLTTNNCITGEIEIFSGLGYPRASIFRDSYGDLFLVLAYVTKDGIKVGETKVYKSALGNGTDWTLYSTIISIPYADLVVAYAEDYSVGIPHIEGDTWILPLLGFYNYGGNLYSYGRVIQSTDNGLTWSTKYQDTTTYTVDFGRKIAKYKGALYFLAFHSLGSTGKFLLAKSTDNGDTWTVVFSRSVVATFGNNNSLEPSALLADSGKLYIVISSGNPSAVLVAEDTPTVFEDFTMLTTIPLANSVYLVTQEIGNKLVVYNSGENANTQVLAATINNLETKLQAKSITINRSKGMAGGLTLEFDNKDAILAPDGAVNPQLLWPNQQVMIKQGYGAELLKTFTGLIDSISMSRDEQGVASVTVSARDKLKVALDHLIRNQDFLYTLTYTNMLVEDIWRNLVGLAGLTYNTVESTGLTISEKTFSWETYADAFSWLDEIAGFETYCDEDGKLNFVWDGRPATVTTAYSFIEGVDITRLGYEINDVDLYYTVAVYGKSPEVLDENDEVVTESMVIYFAKQLPQAGYWNIPSGKVLRIDAPDADTLAKCEIIADKAIYLMQTRARQVSFGTIGIPHLQRGDFIQVEESSTTISEIYRITDITTQQGPDGYGMTLTCYYHAAPEVV